MQRYFKPLIVIVFGLAVVFLGIFVLINSDMNYIGISGTLISIGGTTTLTALGKFVYDVEFHRNEVAYRAYTRLKKYAKIIRRNHTLKLILEKNESVCLDEPTILIRGLHEYKLFNNSFVNSLPVYFEIYTDIGRQCGDAKSGGFERVIVDHIPLSDYKLRESLVTKHHKQYIEIKTEIQKRKEMQFEYHTYGIFRMKDRLIWTVQELSENFDIEVTNKTGFSIGQFNANGKNNEIIFKINHHNENLISQNKIICSKDDEGNDIYNISFDSEILPYQGFEMSWDFSFSDSSEISEEIQNN